MNIHDIDIELPPLPPLHIVPSVEPVDYPEVAQVLLDYARAAVVADRKRRGEPVAFAKDGNLFWRGDPVAWREFSGGLYLAPQPAEPVGEVLGETCIDGGKCHHGCKERCFRRQCCEPFSDYNDPWKYADEPGSPQPAEPDEWKLAVDHELTNMQSTADSYPSAKEAVRALIDWHVAVATDPVVSGQQRGEPIGSVEVKGGLVVVGVDAEHLGDGIHYLYTGPQPAEPVKGPSDDDSLTIAYMSGYHDGKRSMTPEGWQLVPKELTRNMMYAGVAEWLTRDDPEEDVQGIWKAMLAAAPKFGEDL